MKYEEVKEWESTFNTVLKKDSRGAAYEAFKKQKSEILLNTVEKKFPGLKNNIQSRYAATPIIPTGIISVPMTVLCMAS